MDEEKSRREPVRPTPSEQEGHDRATPEIQAHPEGGSPAEEVGSGDEMGDQREALRVEDAESDRLQPVAEKGTVEGALPRDQVIRSLRAGWRVLAYGGGVDFPQGFDDSVHEIVEASVSSAEAAVQIAVKLEASPFTNAGLGSALRLDGATIECDALVLDAEGRRGFAGGLRTSSSPVSVAAFLYRAGGATVRGAAADELAKRLGASDASLLTQAADSDYLSDLRRHAGTTSGDSSGSLESLYVNPEKLTRALTSAPSPPERRQERLPVFVIVTDGTLPALAASSGGIALSHPGAPSLLDAPHNAFALGEQGAVAVLAPHSVCSDGARVTSQSLVATRSSLLAAEKLGKDCPDVPYLFLSENTLRTSIPLDLLYLLGEGLEATKAPINLVSAPKLGAPVKPAAEPVPVRSADKDDSE